MHAKLECSFTNISEHQLISPDGSMESFDSEKQENLSRCYNTGKMYAVEMASRGLPISLVLDTSNYDAASFSVLNYDMINYHSEPSPQDWLIMSPHLRNLENLSRNEIEKSAWINSDSYISPELLYRPINVKESAEYSNLYAENRTYNSGNNSENVLQSLRGGRSFSSQNSRDSMYDSMESKFPKESLGCYDLSTKSRPKIETITKPNQFLDIGNCSAPLDLSVSNSVKDLNCYNKRQRKKSGKKTISLLNGSICSEYSDRFTNDGYYSSDNFEQCVLDRSTTSKYILDRRRRDCDLDKTMDESVLDRSNCRRSSSEIKIGYSSNISNSFADYNAIASNESKNTEIIWTNNSQVESICTYDSINQSTNKTCKRKSSEDSEGSLEKPEWNQTNLQLPLKKRKRISSVFTEEVEENPTKGFQKQFSSPSMDVFNQNLQNTEAVNGINNEKIENVATVSDTSQNVIIAYKNTSLSSSNVVTALRHNLSPVSSLVESCGVMKSADEIDQSGSDLNMAEISSVGKLEAKESVIAKQEISESISGELTIHWTLKPDEDGDLPLHLAVVQNDVGAVKRITSLMTRLSSSIDIYDRLRQTPLHLAVLSNHLEITEVLLEAGASVNIPNRRGWSSIHLAVEEGNVKLLECLFKNSRHRIALEEYCYEGFTPLHLAAMSKNVDMASTLLNYGADVNTRDGKNGRTPLYFSAEKNDLPTLKLLLKSGANPEIANYSGCTPQQAASGLNHGKLVKILEKFISAKFPDLHSSFGNKKSVR